MLMRQQLNTWSLNAPKEVLRGVHKTTADVLQSNPRGIENTVSRTWDIEALPREIKKHIKNNWREKWQTYRVIEWR
jgi:hypothetical protein